MRDVFYFNSTTTTENENEIETVSMFCCFFLRMFVWKSLTELLGWLRTGTVLLLHFKNENKFLVFVLIQYIKPINKMIISYNSKLYNF